MNYDSIKNTYSLLMIIGCTTQDILLYLKDTSMLIGYQMLKTQNPKVVMFLHWDEHQSHGNPQNK